MDRLSELPIKNDTVRTPDEDAVMKRFFPGGKGGHTINSNLQSKSNKTSDSKLKIIAYASILFIILANPWVDKILCKIPYCENMFISTSIKVVLFSLLLLVLMFFA